MGPGLIRIKKIGKSSKNKVLRLYNSPLADSMHSECDSAPQAKQQKVYKTCNGAMCVWRLSRSRTQEEIDSICKGLFINITL